MNLLNRKLKATTCEGKTLDIYIKAAHDHGVDSWKKEGTHQYLVVFHFNNVPNPNYAHSYYIDTIMESHQRRGGGLCLNGGRWEYESVNKETMDNVCSFIQEFVDANQLNLDKEG